MAFVNLFPDPDEASIYPIITIELPKTESFGTVIDQQVMTDRLLAAMRPCWQTETYYFDTHQIQLHGRAMPPWPWICPKTAATVLAYSLAAEIDRDTLEKASIDIGFWTADHPEPICVYEQLFTIESDIHHFWIYGSYGSVEITESEKWSLSRDLADAGLCEELEEDDEPDLEELGELPPWVE